MKEKKSTRKEGTPNGKTQKQKGKTTSAILEDRERSKNTGVKTTSAQEEEEEEEERAGAGGGRKKMLNATTLTARQSFDVLVPRAMFMSVCFGTRGL